MTIHIRNLRDGQLESYNVFLIDRRTPLGNPYVIPADGNRIQVISLFELYFNKWIKHISPLQIYFNEILDVAKEEDVTLMCWCWPLPCHGDIIKRELERRLQQLS